MTEKSHVTSDEQIEVDAAMTQIQKEIERLVEKVYLMGYTKGQCAHLVCDTLACADHLTDE